MGAGGRVAWRGSGRHGTDSKVHAYGRQSNRPAEPCLLQFPGRLKAVVLLPPRKFGAVAVAWGLRGAARALRRGLLAVSGGGGRGPLSVRRGAPPVRAPPRAGCPPLPPRRPALHYG